LNFSPGFCWYLCDICSFISYFINLSLFPPHFSQVLGVY
jgi:hypothetical protein